MLTLGAVAFVFGKSFNYRAMGAGNLPRLFNRLAFMFEPEGTAMANSKLEAIRADILNRCADPSFKAIVVSEHPSTGQYFSKLENLLVGVITSIKGKRKRMEQLVIEDFQNGKYKVLVCHYGLTEVGVNLQLAQRK